MADLAVGRMDMVPGHVPDALEMRIALLLTGHHLRLRAPSVGGDLWHWREAVRIAKAAHVDASVPVWTPAVMVINMMFHLARYRSRGIDVRTVLDLLPAQSDRKFAFAGVGVSEGHRRQQDLAAR